MRKGLACLLALCLCLSLLPMSALAAGTDTNKAIQLVNNGNPTGGIRGYDSTAGYDYIYYGNWTAPDGYTTSGPIKWRVLDDQTNTEGTGLFLLSEVLFGTGQYGAVYFDNSENKSSAWQGSDAQTWCETFYSTNLMGGEQGAVLATKKSDGPSTSSIGSQEFAASTDILNGDKVFFPLGRGGAK